MRITVFRWPVAVALVALSVLSVPAAAPRFFDDDPVTVDDDTIENASGVEPWRIEAAYDVYENQFGDPGDPTPDVRAQNVNTVDEVPDSSWFTNRVGSRRVDPAEIAQGATAIEGPAEGQWTISAGKSDGRSPGFTVTDTAGVQWFLKFDPEEHPGMASGTEATVSRLFWALGYNVPEYVVATVRREQFVVGAGATVQPPGAYERSMKDKDIDLLLEDAPRQPDGAYRIVASLALEGKPLGPFRFYGTRPDDPNDIVPHEHRRELRGYGVFCAWLNHVFATSTNTLDTLVTTSDRTFVRHHLLDFNSTLGSGAVRPRSYWEGFDHLVNVGQTTRGILGLGFYILPWRTVPYYDEPSVGRMPAENGSFDPERWKPRVPNPAFERARPDDKFWAARKLAAVPNALIEAAVRVGRFPSNEAEQFLVRALAERRDAIVRRYFTMVNPVVDPRLDPGGTLSFGNAAVEANVASAPASYRARWSRFDNATGDVAVIGETAASVPQVAAPLGLPASEGAFVLVEISSTGGADPSWEKPVHAYFKRQATVWKLVGFERVPGGTPPYSKQR